MNLNRENNLNNENIISTKSNEINKSNLNNNNINNNKENESKKNQNFESFIVEFKESRDNVLNIIKILIEQGRFDQFIEYLSSKNEINNSKMKDFINSKYYEFVESIDNIKDCKVLVKNTDEILLQLETSIQNFLKDFNINFIGRIKKKELLKNLMKEKEKLNIVYIFYGYMYKADIAVKQQQFELSIRLMNNAYDKFLKKFPINSTVYVKGEQLINNIKNKITTILQEKLTKWLVEINKEQKTIGEQLYKKMKNDSEKIEQSKRDSNIKKSSLRTTKNIVDSLLLIRNTSNLNYMMNKNSVLKNSIAGSADVNEEIEYDIINMVSNVDLKFLEQAYNIYKTVDNESKFLDYFRSFRQSQIHDLVKIDNLKRKEVNQLILYDNFFSELLGFIVIQVSIFELYPMFYSKKKFENNFNYMIKEFQSSLSFEFNTFSNTTEYITLLRCIFIFLNCIEQIGITEKTGIDVRSIIIEMVKEKVQNLNLTLISKYNTMFNRMIIDDINSEGLYAQNFDDFVKLSTQYHIILEENSSNLDDYRNVVYPFKLPYTNFVIEVNENFKNYVNELFEFIKPLYDDYDGIIQEMVSEFLKKLNEVFILFTTDQELNIIVLATICNNIRYILQSHVYYEEYVKKTCNIKSHIILYNEKSLKDVCDSYEEIIFENLKIKIEKFISDIEGEDFMPKSPRENQSESIDSIISYLSVIFINLQSLSKIYIENCFREAVKFIPKFYIEYLFNNEIVGNYNIYFIYNLKMDLEGLDSYFKDINNNYKDFDNVLNPLLNLINNLFINKNLEEFYRINNQMDKFYKLNDEKVLEFIQRYKNLKSKKELKGKLTESEVKEIVKKYKKILGLPLK